MWWDQDHKLWLITPQEYAELPDGIILTAIDGEQVTKTKDFDDLGTRGGHIAYGFTVETAPIQYLHHFLEVKA